MSQTGAPPPPPPAPAQARNGFGTTALTLGIIGALLGLIPIIGLIAIILGVLALVFGLLGFARARRGAATNRIMAIVGAGLGAVAVALGIWGMTIVAGALDEFQEGLQGPVPTVLPGAAPAAGVGEEPSGDGPVTAAPGERVQVGEVTISAAPLAVVDIPLTSGPVACSVVTYEATGQASFNPFDWKLLSAGGVLAGPSLTADDQALSSGELRPGGTVSGRVCFDGEADGATLVYDGTFFGGTQVEFSG